MVIFQSQHNSYAYHYTTIRIKNKRIESKSTSNNIIIAKRNLEEDEDPSLQITEKKQVTLKRLFFIIN